MHRRSGSATLSQLAFPGEGKSNFPGEKCHWDNTAVKSEGLVVDYIHTNTRYTHKYNIFSIYLSKKCIFREDVNGEMKGRMTTIGFRHSLSSLREECREK